MVYIVSDCTYIIIILRTVKVIINACMHTQCMNLRVHIEPLCRGHATSMDIVKCKSVNPYRSNHTHHIFQMIVVRYF